eukprot:6461403-Amphidinium_carterae.1
MSASVLISTYSLRASLIPYLGKLESGRPSARKTPWVRPILTLELTLAKVETRSVAPNPNNPSNTVDIQVCQQQCHIVERGIFAAAVHCATVVYNVAFATYHNGLAALSGRRQPCSEISDENSTEVVVSNYHMQLSPSDVGNKERALTKWHLNLSVVQ